MQVSMSNGSSDGRSFPRTARRKSPDVPPVAYRRLGTSLISELRPSHLRASACGLYDDTRFVFAERFEPILQSVVRRTVNEEAGPRDRSSAQAPSAGATG